MNIEKLNSYCPIIKDNTRFFYLLFKKIFSFRQCWTDLIRS